MPWTCLYTFTIGWMCLGSIRSRLRWVSTLYSCIAHGLTFSVHFVRSVLMQAFWWPFQVSIPLGTHDNCPVSVSFIARHGCDRFLLDTIQTMYATIQEQVDILAKSNVSSKQAMNEEAAETAKEKVSFLIAHACRMYLINFLTPVQHFANYACSGRCCD